jgi:glutamyl-tRNA synthetase
MNKVRTRFAPSPTGFLHIGSLRTALYAYALAKHEKGDFILRIEDTDQKREVEGSTDAIKSTLKKFGLVWDEFYIQSERLELYQKAAKKLVEDGHAFYCQCKTKEVKEDGYSKELRNPCRDKNFTSGAIRLKVPEGETISYHDFVHKKEISWNTDTIYDAMLLKSDEFPTYHLAAMVDDLEMKISHILRGHDWLPSTPIHLLIFKYLGGEMPKIGHLTDILSAETGKKLSKRRDSVFAEQFLEQGYLPEALINFVMLLGWAPKDNRELFTLEEFVEHFDINGFQEANPRFLIDKLDWFNGNYIRQKSDEDLAKLLTTFAPKGVNEERIIKVIPLVKDRLKKLSEFSEFAGFFFEAPDVNRELLGKDYKDHLKDAARVIESVSDWKLESLNEKLMEMVKEKGHKTGDFFMDLRIAITGLKFTPPINDSIIILGKDETISRLKKLM